MKASKDIDFDDFNEDEFDQKENSFEEKEENNKDEEKENKENNNNKLEQNKEENNNNKDEERNNNKRINNINILDKNNLQIEENKKEIDKNIINENKEDNINDGKNNKVLKKEIKIDNLLSNIFVKELCSLCESKLNNKKYICIICNKMIFCNLCGEKHDHPCLIYKSPFISSLGETYNFITQNYIFSSNLFLKKSQRNISIYLLGDKNIYLRPNKGLLIPIKIMNNSNVIISSTEFIIIIKGNKYINISYDCGSKFKILPNSFYILKIKCITPNKICKENINLEVYSARFDLKENSNLRINFNIEINEDMEEESLNFKLCFNEMAILYNKEHKQILVSLIENELKGYDVDDIIELIIDYNWDKNKLLKYISSLTK